MDGVEDAGRDVAGFGEDLESGESSGLGVGLGCPNRVSGRRVAVDVARGDQAGQGVQRWLGSAQLKPDTAGLELGGGDTSRVDRHARVVSGVYTLNITRLSREVTGPALAFCGSGSVCVRGVSKGQCGTFRIVRRG